MEPSFYWVVGGSLLIAFAIAWAGWRQDKREKQEAPRKD